MANMQMIPGRRLIATWTAQQNPEIDEPVRLRWEDGSPATLADLESVDTSSQSDPMPLYGPNGEEAGVEFGYAEGKPHKGSEEAMYTVIGEMGNCTGPYTQAFSALSDAVEAVRRVEFPLAPRSDAQRTYVGSVRAYSIDEHDGNWRHPARHFDLRTGNVSIARPESETKTGTNEYGKQTWPGAYIGCPLTEELISRPKVSMAVPVEWVAYCRELLSVGQ